MLDRYFTLEDPTRLEPAHRELRGRGGAGVRPACCAATSTASTSRPAARSGSSTTRRATAPQEEFEAKALFQMKFYALVLWRSRAARTQAAPAHVPGQRRDRPVSRRTRPTCAPRSGRSRRCGGRSSGPGDAGDWRPRPSRLCAWCAHQAICPAFGGTPPPLPEPRRPRRRRPAGGPRPSDPRPAAPARARRARRSCRARLPGATNSGSAQGEPGHRAAPSPDPRRPGDASPAQTPWPAEPAVVAARTPGRAALADAAAAQNLGHVGVEGIVVGRGLAPGDLGPAWVRPWSPRHRDLRPRAPPPRCRRSYAAAWAASPLLPRFFCFLTFGIPPEVTGTAAGKADEQPPRPRSWARTRMTRRTCTIAEPIRPISRIAPVR